jgi:hypothetical protein
MVTGRHRGRPNPTPPLLSAVGRMAGGSLYLQVPGDRAHPQREHCQANPALSMTRGQTRSVTAMTTIKVSADTRDRLKRLADSEQSTMEVALAKVVSPAQTAQAETGAWPVG